MHLPPKFAALRTETNFMWLQCFRHARPDVPCTVNPVQLLCCALRRAPASYQFFELAAASPEKSLLILCSEEYDLTSDDCGAASFNDVPALADAMQQFAVAERLRVDLSPNQRTIVITRLGK